MRDEMLKNWVEQPPAEPIIQYLRDAERESALDLLGERERVLDVASEANLTRQADADHVTRVDFSEAAIDHAREVLSDAEHVERFEQVDPADPVLPFDDDAFDGAVSLGPYDWKFLDVDALTAELHRVVADDGAFVFSVPTPRSPYHVGSKSKQRYFTPEAAKSLIYPGWELVDYGLVYQYHYRVQDQIRNLDDEWQQRFVELGDRLTDLHTALDRWENASYLVLSVSPTDYTEYADRALECLFRPVEADGFWVEGGGSATGSECGNGGVAADVATGEAALADSRQVSDHGHLLRSHDYRIRGSRGGDRFEWTPVRETRFRYAPLALAGVFGWRDSHLGDERYDEQIRETLAYFADAVADHRDAMPNYGVGPLTSAFARAGDVFAESRWAEVAFDLYEHTSDCAFTHSEDVLLPWGWADLYDATGDSGVRDDVERALWAIADRQGPNGVYAFENDTTRRHQNQMYATWALCRAIEVTGLEAFLDDAERTLEFTVEERMRDDGAFLWEEVRADRRLRTRLGRALGRGTGERPHWDLLYSCHQSFFVNAVAHYYAAGGDRNFDVPVGEAVNWVFGENALGEDLVERSGLGVPTRFLTTDGRDDEPDHQRYEGAYEVGSWILSMVHLTDEDLFGPEVKSGRRRQPPRRESPKILGD